MLSGADGIALIVQRERAPWGARPLAAGVLRLFLNRADRLTGLQLTLDVHCYLLVDRDLVSEAPSLCLLTRDRVPRVIRQSGTGSPQ